MNFCPHCGYRYEWPHDGDACEECYEAMAHCHRPTDRPITGHLVINGKGEIRIIGYYDVNTGKITPKEAQP